jgi:hypothetical protein
MREICAKLSLPNEQHEAKEISVLCLWLKSPLHVEKISI